MNKHVIYIRNRVTLVFAIIFILIPFIVKYPAQTLEITPINIIIGLLIFGFVVYYIWVIVSLLVESFGVKDE